MHGFVVLSGMAEFHCKTKDYYEPEHERCIRLNNLALGIQCANDRLGWVGW